MDRDIEQGQRWFGRLLQKSRNNQTELKKQLQGIKTWGQALQEKMKSQFEKLGQKIDKLAISNQEIKAAVRQKSVDIQGVKEKIEVARTAYQAQYVQIKQAKQKMTNKEDNTRQLQRQFIYYRQKAREQMRTFCEDLKSLKQQLCEAILLFNQQGRLHLENIEQIMKSTNSRILAQLHELIEIVKLGGDFIWIDLRYYKYQQRQVARNIWENIHKITQMVKAIVIEPRLEVLNIAKDSLQQAIKKLRDQFQTFMKYRVHKSY